jgi:hypothetical protein
MLDRTLKIENLYKVAPPLEVKPISNSAKPFPFHPIVAAVNIDLPEQKDSGCPKYTSLKS